MTKNFSSFIKNANATSGDYVIYRKTFELDDFDTVEMTLINNGLCLVYLNGLPVVKTYTSVTAEQNNYSKTEVTDFLMPGENVLAVLICCKNSESHLPFGCISLELNANGKTVLKSDNTFLTSKHNGFIDENCFDSRCEQIEFEYPDYDDSLWETATEFNQSITATNGECIINERPVKPKTVKKQGNTLMIEFDKCYNGCLYLEADGTSGKEIRLTICDGTTETEYKWILKDGFNTFASFVPSNVLKCKLDFSNGVTIDSDSINLIASK